MEGIESAKARRVRARMRRGRITNDRLPTSAWKNETEGSITRNVTIKVSKPKLIKYLNLLYMTCEFWSRGIKKKDINPRSRVINPGDMCDSGAQIVCQDFSGIKGQDQLYGEGQKILWG